jgi:putative ABC transport system permease protein
VSADAVLAELELELDRRQMRGWSARGVQAQWTQSLGDLGRFLALVGFVALLLGGIGVASAVTVYVRQKTETVATLRCIGAPAGQALRAYSAQAAAIGLIAAVLGAAIGVAVQLLLPAVLGPFLPVEVPFGISLRAIATGIGVGVAVALGFAMLPLLAVRRIPPLAAIRPEVAAASGARRDPWRWLIAALLALGVGAFAYVQTGLVVAAVAFPLALIAALLLLAGAARLAMAASRRLVPPGLPYAWRQGLANLYRPGNQTLVLLTTLGLGTGLLLVLYLVQATILGQILVPAGEDRQPGLILFDIQPAQVEAVEEAIRQQGAPVIERVPVVSMRIAAVNEARIYGEADDMDAGADRAGWALRREYRSTYRDYLTPTERVTAGAFTPTASPDAPAPISLSTDIADDLDVRLGDRITWDVGGVPVETVVGSLREVDWARVQPNFFAVFPAGVLEQAPQFHIVTTRTASGDEDALLQRELVRQFPNVSVVDVRLVINLVQGVVDRVAFVLRFMALFALGTGLIVLAGAVRVSRLQRVEEGVLLRTLGASRAQVRRVLLAEYLLLGLLAAVVGAAIALAGAAALAVFAFDAPLVPAWTALAIALLGLPVLTALVGLAGSRGTLAQSPLAILRQAG